MDWFGKDIWATWVGAAVLLAAIEILSLELVFLMFALGALGAALAAWLGAPFWASLAVFGAIATALLLLVRPRFTAKIHDGPTLPRGQLGLVGHVAIVEEPVSDFAGRVSIDGQLWTARSHDPNTTYEVGDRLIVTAIEGATAKVAGKDL